MQRLIDYFRESLGLMLLDWSIRILPRSSSAFEAIERGSREQRGYDHYLGYALFLNQDPLPFERWREQWNWIQAKARMTDAKT